MKNKNYLELEENNQDSVILNNSYHYIPLPAGTPQLPSGVRLSRKSTQSRLIGKDERTGVYYELNNGKWELADK